MSRNAGSSGEGPPVDPEGTLRAGTSARRRMIVERLQEQDFVSVQELADEFQLTGMSLRRDLNALAERGLITRVRGGAQRVRTPQAPRLFREAEKRNAQAKARIARATVALLESAETAFFYSGSTVARVAAALREAERTSLTVVTPSLPVINEVNTWPDPHLVAIGGLYLPAYMAFVGPQAVGSLRAISADVAIVGCDGMSAAEGLTTPHQLVAEIGAVMVERARRTIVVTDSSKIGRRGFIQISAASSVQAVVTDSGADQDELDALREQGVAIHII